MTISETSMIDSLTAPACILRVAKGATPKIVSGNPVWSNATGLKPGEDGMPLEDWLPPRSLGRIALAAENIEATMWAETLDESLILPHGQAWWRMSLTRLVGDSSDLVMLIGTDITVRKRAELAWMRRVVEKEKVSRELSDFVTFAAHDLRAPLRNLQVLAQSLRDQFGEDDSERLSILETMDSVRDGATRLINDVLSYALSQDAKPDRRVVEIGTVCQDLLTILDPLGAHAFSYPVEYIEVDGIAFQLALRNLFDNAIRHSDGNPIEISLQMTAHKDRLEFAVSNTGPKMDTGWDPFGQTADMLGGHGFGLRGLRRLLIARGGRIWSDPVDEDAITCFRFEMPGKVTDHTAMQQPDATFLADVG